MTALQRAAVVTQIAYVGINSDIHSIRLFSLAKHTILALIVTRQPPPSLHAYPYGMPAYTDGERPVCTDIGTAAYRWQEEDFSRGASSWDGGMRHLDACMQNIGVR